MPGHTGAISQLAHLHDALVGVQVPLLWQGAGSWLGEALHGIINIIKGFILFSAHVHQVLYEQLILASDIWSCWVVGHGALGRSLNAGWGGRDLACN